MHSIQKTIATIVYFIYSTLRQSPYASLQDDLNIENIQSSNETDTEMPKLYTALIWNDETHSFNEVIDQSMLALRCSKEKGESIARAVDYYVIDL